VQVLLGQRQHRLRLQGLNEAASQSEEEAPREVRALRRGDRRAFLSALKPQFSFVSALVQIADTWCELGADEGLPHSLIGNKLSPIRGKREARIGPQVGRDLHGSRFINPDIGRLQCRIVRFEPGFQLLPSQRRLPQTVCRQASSNQSCQTQMHPHALHVASAEYSLFPCFPYKRGALRSQNYFSCRQLLPSPVQGRWGLPDFAGRLSLC